VTEDADNIDLRNDYIESLQSELGKQKSEAVKFLEERLTMLNKMGEDFNTLLDKERMRMNAAWDNFNKKSDNLVNEVRNAGKYETVVNKYGSDPKAIAVTELESEDRLRAAMAKVAEVFISRDLI
jgi:hypothetical protein